MRFEAFDDVAVFVLVLGPAGPPVGFRPAPGSFERPVADEADAAYMRYAGSRALLSGDIAAGGDFLSGLSGAVKSMGK
jgi:hypothetical protein